MTQDNTKFSLLSPTLIAGLAFAISTTALAGAWFIEIVLEVKPCHLCLIGRVPYYVGIPLLALALLTALRSQHSLARILLILAAVTYVAGFGIGAYHSGVELKLFAGPTDCTGSIDRPVAIGDFLNQLQTVKIVRCDEIAMKIFGLSLANWNAIVCAALAALAGFGVLQKPVQPSQG